MKIYLFALYLLPFFFFKSFRYFRSIIIISYTRFLLSVITIRFHAMCWFSSNYCCPYNSFHVESPLRIYTAYLVLYCNIHTPLILVTNLVVRNTFLMYKIMQHHTVPYMVIYTYNVRTIIQIYGYVLYNTPDMYTHTPTHINTITWSHSRMYKWV